MQKIIGDSLKASCTAIIVAALILIMLEKPALAAGISIAVNTGAFASVEEAAHGEASLTWDGSSPFEEAACTQSFAALELKHYLRKTTSNTIDVLLTNDKEISQGDLILIGGPTSNALTARLAGKIGLSETELTALGPEGYIIKSTRVDGQRILLIAGGGRVGTLYGVYDYLHRIGCRWFAPGIIHQEIPSMQSIKLDGFDVVEKPKFALRGFHAWEKRGNEDFILWMARNRLNYWCVEEGSHPLLRKLGLKLVWGGHVIGYNYLKPSAPYPYAHARFKTKERLPVDPYPLSNDCKGDVNSDGMLSYLEAHPEWYGVYKGKRSKVLKNGKVNYCTSNPFATKELMKNAVQELIDGVARDAGIVNCWSVDGGKWCECGKCKALGTPTDRNLMFVYDFDKEVKRAQMAGLIKRPITVLFLAYYDVLKPPTRSLPQDFDYETCIATYFPIQRCYVHNFNDLDCSVNRTFSKHLYGWAVDPQRHYKGQICIGEYYNVSGYKCLPICFMHTMQNDIPYYYEKTNARYFHYMHVTTGQWGNKALTNYQMARQLWDHDIDCSVLWDDYFSGRYGPVADDMRAFYSSLEKMLSNVTELKYGLSKRLSKASSNLFSNAHMAFTQKDGNLGPSLTEIIEHSHECRSILERVKKTKLPGRISVRISEDESMFAYGECTVMFYHALSLAYQQQREGKLQEAQKALAQAKALANKLREDKVSATLSSEHANAPDALNASRAAGAIGRLEKLLVKSEKK
jgi:Domain of unknown function (DUF4838)/Glycosyl hydrolase family 67 N-terminus